MDGRGIKLASVECSDLLLRGCVRGSPALIAGLFYIGEGMSLENYLEQVIVGECKKLSQRQHSYHNALDLEYRRKAKRISNPGVKQVKVPVHWQEERKYDPFYVSKRSKQIAHSIAKKIRQGTYCPNPPVVKDVPKSSGGHRSVRIYQIPDAAVSKLIYERLLRKNKHRFSSFSYAYRNDRNVHFAIQDISVELSQTSRVFIAEFDFSKFFDSIDHHYLFDQFNKNGFLISEEEACIVRAFLDDSGMGIPQGTSVSLFLANLVCWRLDKNLEQAGLQFARYADDTVIWSRDYTQITKAYDIINSFSVTAGVQINEKKSDGISLLCKKDMPSEITSRKEEVEFLGYAISVDCVSIKKASVNRIKRQISYILYKHLLKPLQGTRLIAIDIPSNDRDRDLLSAISEIRRYLYGNLTDEMISNYISGQSNRIFFKGAMSFYPLINNERQLKGLDGWLVTAIYKAVTKRSKLLKSWNYNRDHSFPFNVARNKMATEFRSQRIYGKRLLKIPSFYFIYQAQSKGVSEIGLEGVINSRKSDYDY